MSRSRPRFSYTLAYLTPAIGMLGGALTTVIGFAHNFLPALICGPLIVLGMIAAWVATHIICEAMRRADR